MIEDAIRTALLPAFGSTQLILAHQNGPRPSGVYATVRIEQVRKTPALIGQVRPDGTRELAAHGIGQLEVQCFGDGSFDVLDSAIQLLASEDCLSAAAFGNFAFGPTDRVQSVPALRNDSSWEERAVVSLPFAYTRSLSESVSWIETVEGTITVDAIVEPYAASIVE